MQFAFILLFAISFQASTVFAVWNYDTSDATDGPSGWASTYPACGLMSQSPIDIVTDDAQTDDDLTAFTFANYDDTSVAMTLTNGGHGAALSLTGATLTLSGGGLPEDFTFQQLHFHWGASDTTGSEHTLDGTQYPLELHVVHYANSDGNFTSAAVQTEGLAVLGIFFELSSDANPDLANILTAMSSVQADGDTATVTSFSIYDLISDALGPYYRYSGSLTTPGCFESVIWTVFERKLTVSASQLATFRTIQDSSDNALTFNYRPTQALNSRTVSYYDDGDTSGAEPIVTSLKVLGGTSAVTMLLLLML